MIGFPVAVGLAWAFEITPEGIVKNRPGSVRKNVRWQAGRKARLRHHRHPCDGDRDLALSPLLALPSDEHEADIPEKSIAVLPFENYSADKENAFFADGIQDDLLTNLAKIKALTVISRTSVMKYRDVGARDIKDIGKSLGVANILEGSVRREQDRVAVNVQLIDALTIANLGQHYERTLEDSLGLEGELATEIADALRARLTPDEKVRVKKKPTQNADAYDLYLRALPYEQGPDTLLQDYRRAVELYSQAIQLDPDFALAHARLASTCAEIYHFHEPLDSWKDRRAAKRRPRSACNLTSAKRISPSANAPIGLTTITSAPCANSRPHKSCCLTTATSPHTSPRSVAAKGAGRKRSRPTSGRRSSIPQNPNIIRNFVFTNTLDAALAAGGASRGPFPCGRARFGRGEDSNRLRRVLVERRRRRASPEWVADIFRPGTIPTES